MPFTQKHIPDLTGKKPGTLIHLGAGRCRELETWLQAGFREIVLVEPDKVRAAELLSRVADHDRVRVVENAVSAADGESELNVLNYPDANSLRKPERLLELFPGIRIRKRVETRVIGIDTLLHELDLTPDAVNGLLIDTPGEEHVIIESLLNAKAIDYVSFITLQAPTVPLYAGARPLSAIESLLQDAGFELESGHGDDEDPIRPIRQFERDLAALERKRLSQQLAKAEKDREALQDKLKQAEASSESAKTKLKEYESQISDLQADLQELRPLPEQLKKAEAANGELSKQLTELESKAFELKKVWEERSQLKRKLEEAESKAADASTRAKRLEKELDEARTENKRLLDHSANQPPVGEEIKRIFTEQFLDNQQALHRNLRRQVVGELKSALRMTAQRVEATVGIASFLQAGELIPDFSGKAPVAPDLALFIAHLIERQKYDLVVEFGSGKSTVLMAQVFRTMQGKELGVTSDRRKQVLSYSGSDKNEDLVGVEVSLASKAKKYSNLLPRVVSFEHSSRFYKETEGDLESFGVSGFVDLIHAPLVEYSAPEGRSFYYYDCFETLRSIRARMVNQEKILVLVDGPPGVTCDQARYPAVPVMLDYFSGKEIDFLLDDSVRDDEKQIVGLWEDLIGKRGFESKRRDLDFEKGAVLIEVR